MSKPSIGPCPHLLQVHTILPTTHAREHRSECGIKYYIACLELAQSQWLRKRPSQAILYLNKAMMARLAPNDTILDSSPIPYEAMIWIINNSTSGQFLGNPVRHFQHLASRMNWKQPQPELRIARAWCCFHLAESNLNNSDFPRDHAQIRKEALNIPTEEDSIHRLHHHSPHSSEAALVRTLLKLTI